MLLGHFLLFDWAWSKLSKTTTIWLLLDPYAGKKRLGSLNSKDKISLVKINVMDIVWMLCDIYVWRLKFNIRSYGFVKLL